MSKGVILRRLPYRFNPISKPYITTAAQEGKYGMRWRTNQEVVASKGQFICGAKSCDRMESLESFEVPFGYREDGQQKVALVKVIALGYWHKCRRLQVYEFRIQLVNCHAGKHLACEWQFLAGAESDVIADKAPEV